jgi:hypothetical protein
MLFSFGLVVHAEVPKESKIIVGQNILVSRDGDIPHVELIVAANPRNPKNLVGAAITQTSTKGSWATKTYSTVDGGSTWYDSSFSDLREAGALDPQVGFGIQGTAYFSTIRYVKDEKGQDHGGLVFFRSEDSGRTWSKPLDLGYSYDHPILGVDQTTGKYAGRIYISVLYGYPVYTVGIFRSDDDGRTFVGPVEAANGGGKFGINTISNIVILSDGTLVVPYVDFEFDPEKAKKLHSLNFWVVISSDGGLTFSKPQKIGSQEVNNTPEGLRFFSVAAAAADPSNAFRDRIYLTWNDFQQGKYRMVVSSSSDRGKLWTKPILIDSDVPQSATQFQPAIAVNKDGVLAITWFDTRNSDSAAQYDEYLAISENGGKSFLRPVRISSQSSFPEGGGNQSLIPSAYMTQGKLMMDFTSAYSRWSNGGDYMGLAADKDGKFHAFWADSRTRTFQINTAEIRVVKQEKKEDAPSKRVESDVTEKVEILFDPTKYDPASKTLEIPIHIKNKSEQIIYGPVHLELVSVGGGFEWEDVEENKKNAPEILNASNDKKGAGAMFDFSSALGSQQMLEPGELSGEVLWKMKVVDPNRIPSLRLKVTGSILEKK